MTAPDWKLLLVTVNDRTAIFSENFPAKIARGGDEVQRWFSHDEAHEVLYTVAGAWPTLGRNHADTNTRYLYRSGFQEVPGVGSSIRCAWNHEASTRSHSSRTLR